MTGARRDERRLGHLSTTEVDGRITAGATVALLPVGSTEAHGPHLPLATDVVIAEEAALRAADRLAEAGTAALVLPPIPYAVTEFVSSFRGTVSVRAGTVAALIEEIAGSLFKQGVRTLVLVNGHLEPEHARMLKEVAHAINARGEGRAIFPDQRRPPTVSRLGEEFGRGGGHAGGYETSLVMAARPELVGEETRRALRANFVDIAERIRGGATDAVSAGGDEAYFGDPANASVEEGDRLYDVLASMIRDAVTGEHEETSR